MKIFREWRKINQTKALGIRHQKMDQICLQWAILVVGQKLDGKIIIYSSKQLFIPEESPNLIISFDQSHTIKENKKKVFNWYNNKKFGILIKRIY